MKQTLIITVGVSNSGKSTAVKEFLQKNTKFVEVNRDNIRTFLFCENDITQLSHYKYTKSKEDQVTHLHHTMIEEALKSGKGVVCSDTNLNPKYRKVLADLAKKHGTESRLWTFEEDLHVCKARNLKRVHTVPPSVLERQYKQMREFLKLPTYTPQKDAPQAVIADLDGTVACMDGVRGPFEWDKVLLDKPKEQVIALVKWLRSQGVLIIFLSGRDGVCFEDTVKWLDLHVGKYHKLIQRAKGDQRPDVQIKEEIFWRDIAPNYNVTLAIDDRNQIVDLWRALGIECWQVQSGDF